MTKVLSFIILSVILYVPSKAQNIIKTDEYRIEYSELLEQPTRIEYTITCPKGRVSRRGLSFWKPDSLQTSDNQDYENNIWDKGHMAPAASFSCTKESLYSVFNYANCSLQHQSLNRGVWRELEEFERTLANFYEVSVVIDVVFDETPERVPGGAAIPTEYLKTIKWDGRVLIVEIPNDDTRGTQWIDYLILFQ